MLELILASASLTRSKILSDAGLSFRVQPSAVEELVVPAPTAEVVRALASEKARAVAAELDEGLVLGCDSLLDVEGTAYGKPASAEDASVRWRALRGQSGTLFTGHVLVDAASGRESGEVVATIVHFGMPSDREIDEYVRSGEPLDKAGAFTLEGRSSAFLEGIEGDAGNVRGLSLAALARLLRTFDRSITDFWT